MEHIEAGSVIILLLQFLRNFGGFSNTKSVGFWGSAPDTHGGAYNTPPYPLAGQEGCLLPHPPQGSSANRSATPLSAPPLTHNAGSATVVKANH